MEPSYFDGDRVVTLNWCSFKSDDVVVFQYKDKIYIKRIMRIINKKIIVEGDNKSLSSKVKPIRIDQIIGKVVWSY